MSAMEGLRPALAIIRPPRCRQAARSLFRCLHISCARCATPLDHIIVTGPPPKPPKLYQPDLLERVARKKRQAEVLKQVQDVRTASTPSSKPKALLQKRFWKEVAVRETDDGLQIYLDDRPVRRPDKQILTIPHSKHQLATAIAIEWDQLLSAQQALKTHYIPMTSLASRALDIQAADVQGDNRTRNDILRQLMRHLATDTLLCWAPEKVLNDSLRDGKTLRQVQAEAATNIIRYLTTHVWPGVEIKPIMEPNSILPVSQPDVTQEVIREWLAGLPAFELAGLERAVLASKSLLVSVRLVHEWAEAFRNGTQAEGVSCKFGVEEAAEASSLEVRWQTEQWGEVEDTHDVEKEDLLRQLGSTVILVGGER